MTFRTKELSQTDLRHEIRDLIENRPELALHVLRGETMYQRGVTRYVLKGSPAAREPPD